MCSARGRLRLRCTIAFSHTVASDHDTVGFSRPHRQLDPDHQPDFNRSTGQHAGTDAFGDAYLGMVGAPPDIRNPLQ